MTNGDGSGGISSMPSRFFAQSTAPAHHEQNSKPLVATITNANTSHRKHSLDLLRLPRYTLLIEDVMQAVL